jgi:hypothetical protein
MIPHIVLPVREYPYVICLHFLYIPLYVHKQPSSHNVQNIVHDNYLVLFTSLCCTHDAGFHLLEDAVGGL